MTTRAFSSDRQPDVLSAVALFRMIHHYGLHVGGSLLIAYRRWKNDDASSMAAAVAYYLALSLFPMLLLLIAGVGLVMRFTQLGQNAETQILVVVAEHCSPTLETQVREVLAQLRSHSLLGGPFGLVTAILAAIGVFHQFERAFDKIWRIPDRPQSGLLASVLEVLGQRVAAFVLLASVGLLIVVILAANVAIGAVRSWMTSLNIPGTSAVVLGDMTTTLLLNSFAFGMLYRWLPKRPVGWSAALRGGMLVAVIWEVGRQVLSAFLIGMRYTTAYGAIGSFIALLLWFYWGVTVLFFGAEYVQVISHQSRAADKPKLTEEFEKLSASTHV
ncbi:MAG: YihY/virulence factor BrkB family protein [Planctomycetales bacterium]|nr:YihY/virulence factor BrkB family protein [Planctomycetales bacterium]